MPQIKNNINKFLEEENIGLLGLFVVLAKKNNISLFEYFPVNSLSLVYYVIAYTFLDEDLAMSVFRQVKLAFEWVNSIDEVVEKDSAFNGQIFRDHKSRLSLESEIPTTFLRSATERIVSQSIPMLVSQTKSYQYKINSKLPFAEEEIANYLFIKSADSYLYSAILESVLPELTSLQMFLSGVWQMNDFVDDCVDYEEDKKLNQPNALVMIENLHNRALSVADYAREFLSKRKESLAGYKLPEGLEYLAGLPKIFETIGYKVIEKNYKEVS